MLEVWPRNWHLGSSHILGQQLDVVPFLSAADASSCLLVPRTAHVAVAGVLAGVPAIVTDVGGMAEWFGCGAGITVSATDPAEMADAILRLATNDSERELFSAMGTGIQKRFTLEAMVDAYMDLYQNSGSET